MPSVVGAMAHALAWIPHDDCAALLGGDGFDPEEAVEALVAFCAAGMQSPVSEAMGRKS